MVQFVGGGKLLWSFNLASSGFFAIPALNSKCSAVWK